MYSSGLSGCARHRRSGGLLRAAAAAQRRDSCSGPGADDHKVLFTYKTFSAVFEDAGFDVILLEHFDEAGEFHCIDWSPEDGQIDRSRRFDQRNRGTNLKYTSIILDAVKPAKLDRTRRPSKRKAA